MKYTIKLFFKDLGIALLAILPSMIWGFIRAVYGIPINFISLVLFFGIFGLLCEYRFNAALIYAIINLNVLAIGWWSFKKWKLTHNN